MLVSKQQGFILFTTLIVLSCIILVVLAHMQVALIFSKYLGQEKEQAEVFQHLEKTVELLLSQPAHQVCTSKSLDANIVIKKLAAKKGCQYSDAKYSYNYIIEDLGDYPCLKTILSKKVYSTEHRLFSLLIWAKTPQLLQVRYLRAIADMTCDLPKPLFINIGLSSWRYLSRIANF